MGIGTWKSFPGCGSPGPIRNKSITTDCKVSHNSTLPQWFVKTDHGSCVGPLGKQTPLKNNKIIIKFVQQLYTNQHQRHYWCTYYWVIPELSIGYALNISNFFLDSKIISSTDIQLFHGDYLIILWWLSCYFMMIISFFRGDFLIIWWW